MIQKKRVLWLSDSPMTNTGYATISRNILNGLSKKGYDCHYIAHNYVGQSIPAGLTLEDGLKLNFTIHGNGREPYCRDILQNAVQELQPDYFIILLDTFMLYPWITQMNFSPAKTVFYFPSDGGGGLPQGCDHVLRSMTRAVGMSKFAQQQCKESHNLDVDYIPHAVDAKLFSPCSDEVKQKIRREYVVKTVNGGLVKGALLDKYVVGCVARNQGRKMLDRGLRSFAEFCKEVPDAVLYLHTDPQDAAAVFDISHLIKRLNIENRVFFSPYRFFKNLPYEEMPKVYQLMDCFLLSTSGEGWGVPTIEAMSCGIPVLVTDYTTTKEIVTDHHAGVGVELESELTGSWCVDRGLMSIQDGALQLRRLYDNESVRKSMGLNGRRAVETEYDWPVVIDEWVKFLGRT